MAWQISFSPSFGRCFVSAWVLDLRKNTGWFTGEKVPFLWSTIHPANFDTFNGNLELVPSGISPFIFFFCPSMRRYRIEYFALYPVLANNCPTHTQLAIKWFTQMTKTLKTLFFFICYHPSPRQPAGKVQSFAWNNITGCCCCLFVFFFLKSVGIPVFLLMQCKSGSLCFLHKLLNETA